MKRTYHKDGTLPLNGEVFVFGSNLRGRHGAGAAKVAAKRFGAEEGCGTGWFGQSYALPTKDYSIQTMPLDLIQDHINWFAAYTRAHPDTCWFVTRVGCGLAGHDDNQIAPLFKDAFNCSFAEQWREYLE